MVIALLLFAGCEPLRGISAQRDYRSSIDISCVDRALRDTFGKVERWDYVSDGNTFPKDADVAQFAYYHSSDQTGWATINIGSLEQGTRITHEFTGIGAKLPQASFPPALRAMNRTNQNLYKECGIDLSGMKLRQIGQEVDALN